MKIILSPEVAINLEAMVSLVGNHEFSGVGFVEFVEKDLYVYDAIVLDVGSAGYSEIPADKLMEAVQDREDRNKLRLWFHRHPVEGWSSTDLNTINTAPLGGIPELVKWSASIVRTPTGWIGRIDNHVKKTWAVAEVEPNIDPGMQNTGARLLLQYFQSIEGPLQYDELYLEDDIDQLDFFDDITKEVWYV